MAFIFDDLPQNAVGRKPGETQALLLEPVLVGGIDLIAVAVTFGYFGGAAIDGRDPAAALERRGVCAKPHRSAEIAVFRPSLQFIAPQPFRHQANHWLLRRPE